MGVWVVFDGNQNPTVSIRILGLKYVDSRNIRTEIQDRVDLSGLGSLDLGYGTTLADLGLATLTEA